MEQSAPQTGTGLFVLLMQDVCDATFHSPQLQVHMVQELVQVCPVQLTALNQNLQEEGAIEAFRGFRTGFTLCSRSTRKQIRFLRRYVGALRCPRSIQTQERQVCVFYPGLKLTTKKHLYFYYV